MAYEHISEDFARTLCEAVDAIDQEFGFDPTWEPTPEAILTAVKQYRRQVDHRRMKSKKDSKLIQQFNKLPEAQRKALMAKLGVEE